jgi:hypothetical protein
MALADAKKEITDDDIKRVAGGLAADTSVSDVAV